MEPKEKSVSDDELETAKSPSEQRQKALKKDEQIGVYKKGKNSLVCKWRKELLAFN